MRVTVGQRLASTVCGTEVIVLRADTSEAELSCGGSLMTPVGSPEAHSGTAPEPEGEGTLAGKRYVDDAGHLEVLCTKGGLGGLTLDGTRLSVKAAKSLPSSD